MTIALQANLLDQPIQTAITGDQLVYVVDSSNIEARMLAWESRHDDLLEQFRQKQDVYSNFASLVYGYPINKYDNPEERFLGKTCVLGLGYQVGWKKLQGSLATADTPLFIDELEARRIVNLYRSVNAPIPRYWAEAEAAIADMYLGNERDWGPLRIYKNALIMPNGMALQYTGLHPVAPSEDGSTFGGWEYWNGKFWTNLYGGKLVENITQALSRIVLFGQMLKINDLLRPHGGRVVLNVHDEIIGVGPSFGARYLGKQSNDKGKLVDVWDRTDKAQALFEQMVTIMRTPPAWCRDLPLDGEGGFAFEYSK